MIKIKFPRIHVISFFIVEFLLYYRFRYISKFVRFNNSIDLFSGYKQFNGIIIYFILYVYVSVVDKQLFIVT